MKNFVLIALILASSVFAADSESTFTQLNAAIRNEGILPIGKETKECLEIFSYGTQEQELARIYKGSCTENSKALAILLSERGTSRSGHISGQLLSIFDFGTIDTMKYLLLIGITGFFQSAGTQFKTRDGKFTVIITKNSVAIKNY